MEIDPPYVNEGDQIRGEGPLRLGKGILPEVRREDPPLG